MARPVFFLAFALGFRAGAFLPAFFFTDVLDFARFAFLAKLRLRLAISEDAVSARRWAVFAILPTVDPTPMAMVVIRSSESTGFLGMFFSTDLAQLVLPRLASAANVSFQPVRLRASASSTVQEGIAPVRLATNAPTRFAKSAMRIAGHPQPNPCTNAAAKASPDPTVSATFTG